MQMTLRRVNRLAAQLKLARPKREEHIAAHRAYGLACMVFMINAVPNEMQGDFVRTLGFNPLDQIKEAAVRDLTG